MKLKTFRTHTLTVLSKPIEELEYKFNNWGKEGIAIVRTDYFVQKRVNKHGTEYEEMVLFVFYN